MARSKVRHIPITHHVNDDCGEFKLPKDLVPSRELEQLARQLRRERIIHQNREPRYDGQEIWWLEDAHTHLCLWFWTTERAALYWLKHKFGTDKARRPANN